MKEIKQNYSNSVLVSVGAGTNQLPFIKAAKKRGIKVASFGKGKNNSEAIELSDYFEEIDTSNFDEAINWLNALDENIIAAGSYAGGRAIKTLLKITNLYNLPTKVPNDLIIGMEKEKQQQLYLKFGLSQIKTYTINDINKNLELLNDETLYVLKPSIGRGSADVLFIEGKNLKNKILNNEVQASNVVQEVSFGQEYRVLLIVQNSEIKLLAPLKRENFKNTFFLGKLYFCKDSLNYKRIVEHANKLIKEMNIVNSIIKYDIIVEENKINLIEMDIGVGGGIYFKTFISKIFNIDLTELYLDLICGFPIDVYLPKNTNLMMTYVFNETNKKITYDVEECRNELSLKFGHVELLVNQLRPENKNSFESNADFIFTVIHENDESDGNQWIINDFVNEHLFKVEK
ncbi:MULTISPECIES: ATP-grasp domain-containing protein [Ureibacillus]|uniref:ATP-grasp domain-containing protein n=1 Tax=Ureibacillus TaxID=160795 RepID=UPI0002FFFB5E|nr:ATP-grasp domain-containing protein [Ureibacillus thermosphaericus]